MRAPNEQFATVGDVELCYETFGESGRPAILLVMGLGTQMLGWHEDFCTRLAERGSCVIRYQNRDVGHSTTFSSAPPPTPRELLTRKVPNPAYTLDDMADDGIRLLDALGIEEAHVVGASMGGMIAQVIAGRHPDRVLSLVSIMSTTGNRWKGQPALRVFPFLLRPPARDRDVQISRVMKLFKVVGSPGFERDEAELREMLELSFERGSDPAGMARQLGAIVVSGDRTAAVRRISAPTLVIHGTKDKMVRVSGGRATAQAIPGARLLLIRGMGHDLPRGAWPRIIDGIAQNAAGARTPAAAT